MIGSHCGELDLFLMNARMITCPSCHFECPFTDCECPKCGVRYYYDPELPYEQLIDAQITKMRAIRAYYRDMTEREYAPLIKMVHDHPSELRAYLALDAIDKLFSNKAEPHNDELREIIDIAKQGVSVRSMTRFGINDETRVIIKDLHKDLMELRVRYAKYCLIEIEEALSSTEKLIWNHTPLPELGFDPESKYASQLVDETEHYPFWLRDLLPRLDFRNAKTDDQIVYASLSRCMVRDYLEWLTKHDEPTKRDIIRWLMMANYLAEKLYPDARGQIDFSIVNRHM